jgi:ligand-binding sensor domain-containing protein
MKEKYAFKLLTSLILLLIVNIYTKAQFSSLRFERYNIIDGLSNNSINCILQTRDGYLWIATKDGLNRFDGKTFTVFKYDPSNKESLPENYVMSLYESKNGNLWVGTWGGGLCKYDPISESFIKIHLKLQNDNYIQNIAEDSNGNLWFGTLYGGIFKFNPQQNTLINYNNSSQSKIKIPNNNVTCILINQDNTIWYSTWGSGFGLLDETKKVIKSFTPNPKINSLAHNNIWHLQKYGDNKILISTDYGIDLFDIKTNSFYHNLNLNKKYFPILNSPIRLSFIDDKGQILVGTYEYHGIFIIKEDKGKFHVVSHIQKEEDNSYSLSMDRIRWIYQDNRKNIWLGTEDGLNKLQTVNLFERYEYFPHRKNTLGGKVVSGIISEHDSILWVSYAGSGFDKIDLKKNKIEHFINKANNLNSLSENDVTTIFKDSKNEIWIGTSHSGLNRFNPRNKKFSHFIFSDNYRYINDLNWIQQILEMKDGTLLVGTNAGLFSFDRKRLNFVEFNPIINGRKIFPEYFSINSLYEDSSGNLWVGTWLDGLFCLNEKEKRFFHLLNNGKNSSSISSNKITCITEDKNGNIWFGTHSGGINKLIVKEMRIENITTANGLPNDVIFGIIEDEKRNIWVSTLNGLCRYDPKTKKIRIFNNSEGVINNQFNWHASYKSKNGKIYFGTVNGFISFHPSEIKIDSIPPKVVLTSFKVFGKEKKYRNQSLQLKK